MYYRGLLDLEEDTPSSPSLLAASVACKFPGVSAPLILPSWARRSRKEVVSGSQKSSRKSDDGCEQTG